MGNWHQPDPELFSCAICLAGAVLAKTLGCPRNKYMSPMVLSHRRHMMDSIKDATDTKIRDIEGKLLALNAFRSGDYKYAFSYLGIAKPATIPDQVLLFHFDNNEPQFYAELEQLAQNLQNEGL